MVPFLVVSVPGFGIRAMLIFKDEFGSISLLILWDTFRNIGGCWMLFFNILVKPSANSPSPGLFFFGKISYGTPLIL